MRYGSALLLLLTATLFSGCFESPLALIPKPPKDEQPPFVRAFDGAYVIFPRPLHTNGAALNIEALNKILKTEEVFFELRNYDEKGNQVGAPIGHTACVTAEQWKIIEEAAKEDGGNARTAGAIGGKSCYSTKLTGQELDAARKAIDLFFATYLTESLPPSKR